MTRPCPLCNGPAGQPAFPYSTRFNGFDFTYIECEDCGCTFVDPVPDHATFELMYSKARYHDVHYENASHDPYDVSARLLARFLPKGATVLDYGCGAGGFLQALKTHGFHPTGVEFDRDAAEAAARKAGCRTCDVARFDPGAESYDALHMGDVLEHLPQPVRTLKDLLACLKPGGLLFVEGPLENNASPVYWSARAFRNAKRLLHPAFVPDSAPTHLLRVNERQQRNFFAAAAPSAAPIHWEITETGWPYAEGGRIQRLIARAAQRLSGKTILGTTFGNRFRAIHQIPTETK